MNELMLSLVTAGYAWWCAMDDADAIAEGKKIRHGLQWAMRAAWVLGWCWLFDAWLLALPLAFLFSGVFRLCLNRLRSLDVRYVSPSSWYDYLFLVLFGAWTWKPRYQWTRRNWRAFVRHSHIINMDLDATYAKQVHRAGTIAYVFEAVAYGVGLYAF